MNQIARAQAKEVGLKTYFAAKPCHRGHVSERLVSDGHCVECSKQKPRNLALESLAKRKRRAADPERQRKAAREYWAREKDALNAGQRARYSMDGEASRLRQRLQYASNLDHKRAQARAKQARRYEQNPAMFIAYARLRHENIKRAVPVWFGELDEFVWREAFALSAARAAATGFAWNADHMIPVRAKEASGLHTWNNCQVIPRAANRSKSNKMLFTQRGEWIGALL